MKDSKPIYSLNFCPNRIDFFYNEPGTPKKKLSNVKEEYLNYFSKIVALVKDEYCLSTSRIAIIVKALSDVEAGRIYFCRAVLCKCLFFQETHALEIHSLEKRRMKEFDINRWFRIKTARTPTAR